MALTLRQNMRTGTIRGLRLFVRGWLITMLSGTLSLYGQDAAITARVIDPQRAAVPGATAAAFSAEMGIRVVGRQRSRECTGFATLPQESIPCELSTRLTSEVPVAWPTMHRYSISDCRNQGVSLDTVPLF